MKNIQVILEENILNIIKGTKGLEYFLSEVEQSKLYKAIKAHQLRGVAFKTFDHLFDQKTEVRFKRKYFKEKLDQKLNFDNLSSLFRILNENKLEYAVLKGISYALYYPDPISRKMSDVDLLIRQDELMTLDKLLLESGYIRKSKLEHFHIVYDKENSFRIEVHTNFINPETYNFSNELTKRLFENIVTESLFDFQYKALTIEMKIITCILHMYKHVKNSGFGYKQLIDLYFLMQQDYNQHYIEDYFNSNESKKFYYLILAILNDLCKTDYGIKIDISNQLLEYTKNDIFASGVYGFTDKERYLNLRIADYTDENKKHFISYLLPNRYHMTKQKRYAYCKYIFLLPIGWLHRIIYNYKRGSVNRDYFDKVSISKRKDFTTWLINDAKKNKDIQKI